MKTFLLTVIIVIVAFRVMSAIIFRVINKTINTNRHDRMKNNYDRNEGEITIENKPPLKNTKSDDEDYADYEEVK